MDDALPLDLGPLEVDEKTNGPAAGSQVVETLRGVFAGQTLDTMDVRLWLVPMVALALYGGAGWPEPRKLHRLLVYGDGFVFGVHEPDGWTGDTEIAAKFGSNTLFYRGSRLPDSGALVPLIRVRVNNKIDENTVKDLQHDMEEYKRQYPKVQFEDIRVDHPTEYVAYLNPGKGNPIQLAVSLSKRRVPATREELGAYREVVRSLVLLKPQ